MDALMKLSLFAARLLEIYSFLIWIRIIISWFRPYPRVGSFTYYIARIVDPYLAVFRSDRTRAGRLDFSPLVAIGLLSVVVSLLSVFGTFGRLTLGIIISQLIAAFWGYGISVYLFFIIMMQIFRLIAAFTHSSAMYQAGMQAAFSDPITDLVRGCFSRSIPRDSTVSLIALAITIALYFVLRFLFLELLYPMALNLPI